MTSSVPGIIYKATNLINNTIYIGKTTTSLKLRVVRHKDAAKTENAPFYKAIREFGWKNFKWEKIDDAENEQYLVDKEEFYIKKYSENSYNVVTRLISSKVSVIKYLYEIEKLTQTEVVRLTGISEKNAFNIFHNITHRDVQQTPHTYTKEQIENVKQETLDIQKELNSNMPPQSTESKMKKSSIPDETISDMKWFLENSDLCFDELKKLFDNNYNNFSDLKNNKTRTWVKTSKSVSKELLGKADRIKNNHRTNQTTLQYKISIAKKILKDKLLNQTQCGRVLEISQPLVSLLALNKSHTNVLPIEKIPDDILLQIDAEKEKKRVDPRTRTYLTKEYKKYLDENKKTSRSQFMKIFNVTEHIA